MLKKLSLKSAGILAVSMNGIAIMVHLLVIFQIVPYNLINGGRSDSFAVAKHISSNSIPILLFGIIVYLIASRIIQLKLNNFLYKVLIVLLWINVAYLCIGFIQQLLGTTFERVFMSIVVLISLVSGIRLAVEKRLSG